MYNQITITQTKLIVSPGRPRPPLGAEGSHSGALEARDRYLS